MKKHLAVICGIFYPEPSPTGLCAGRFSELLLTDYEIDLICISSNGLSETAVLKNGITVHTLAGTRLSKEKAASGLTKKILHFAGSAQLKLFFLGNLSWYRKAAKACLEKINSDYPLDAVFSICSPFSAHYAAMDFKSKYPSVHWCAYTVDPYSTENRIRAVTCSLKKLKNKERYVLSKPDSLLLSEEVYESRKDLYENRPDCRPLPYILPERELPEGKRRFFKAEDINCVYAGSFYKDIRNPEEMLKTFAALKDARIKLHLFSAGCEELVERYVGECPNIILHSRIPHADIPALYRDADILVEVSNNVAEFLPSKTYEYIATGKPILSFGNGNKALEAYPLALSISTAADSGKSAKEFILKNKGSVLSEKEIRDIYRKHTAPVVKQILLDSNTY